MTGYKKKQPKDIELLCKLYKQGFSVREVVNITKDTEHVVYRTLKENGLIRPKARIIDEYKVCDLYNSIKIRGLCKLFKCNYQTIINILNKNNINHSKRKYTLKENIFKKIDTPEKAYLLGFIYADGGVYKNVLTIGQSGIQHKILYSFKSIFETDKEIYNVKNNGDTQAYSLTITSKEIINDLLKFGVMEDKSFKIRYPAKKIKKEFAKHFIRGYFDGDGYLTIRKNRKSTAEFAICSNDNFCADIKNVLKQFNIESRICKNKTHKISELRIGKFDEINKLYKLLYSDTNLYLTNKHDKFLELFMRKGIK